MKETFGQYIRALREERGLTQRALSQAVGFRSLAHLSDIESGKRNPAKETFAKFAKVLGVTVEDLERRDIRGPIEAAKALFARKPEMVGAFLEVIEAARKMDADELVARVRGTLQSGAAPAPKEPKPKPGVSKEAKVPEPDTKPADQPTLF